MVEILTGAGHEVVIQPGGRAVGFSDEHYRDGDATLGRRCRRSWVSAEPLVKVKEPLPSEYPLLRAGPAPRSTKPVRS